MNHNQQKKITCPLSSIPGLNDWLSVVRTYQTCEKLMARRLTNIGITLAQYDVFASLLIQDGQTQQQLAEHNLIAKSNVSGIIQRMLANGWVERITDSQDARKYRVLLTNSGKQLALQGVDIQKEVIKTMCDSVSTEESEQVAAICNKMRHALLSELS